MFVARVAIALVPACALAGIDIEPIFPTAEAEQPTFHLRHGRPALLKYGHHLDHWAGLEDAEASDLLNNDLESDTPMALPGRHPSVEKALDGMSGDLQGLKEQREAAKEVRGELEGTVTDAVQHMNDATSLKQAMVKKENQMRMASSKLKVLEADAAKLGGTQSNLVSSLRRMLGPKVMFARERFEKKEKILQKEEEAAKAWQEKRDQLKESAMALIKQKHEQQQSLIQAEQEVEQAKKKAELARSLYEDDRRKTADQVQSYRYAETRFAAEVQHEAAAKAAAMAAHEALEHFHQVYRAEEQKVDHSVSFRKERLTHKIREVEAARQKSTEELEQLSRKYKDWQEQQRERTAEVVKKSQDTAVAQEAFAAGQQQVLDTASKKVVRDADGVGDWDDWSGDDSFKAADELDDF